MSVDVFGRRHSQLSVSCSARATELNKVVVEITLLDNVTQNLSLLDKAHVGAGTDKTTRTADVHTIKMSRSARTFYTIPTMI